MSQIYKCNVNTYPSIQFKDWSRMMVIRVKDGSLEDPCPPNLFLVSG